MNRLGASFFFVQSGAGDLGSTKGVIPTIAYQLAALQHGFRSHIASAAREYTKFESASLGDQMKSLIMDPVARARDRNPWLADIPVIIVLDALDEAGGDLVNLLKTLKDLVDAQYNIRIFATTRPESSVDHALHESGMNASMEKVNVEDVPQREVNADIQRFLQERFASLRWRNELLAAYPEAISELTENAERLFIYARTAIEYLDHRTLEVSVRRLKAILGDSEGKTGMPALDALYATVLQNAYDDEALEGDDVRKRVTALLAGLVVFRQSVTVEVLAPLMGLKEDAVIRTVKELRSILSCSSEDLRTAIIRPLHLTFAEFLVDPKRWTNVALYIDRSACHLKFVKACLGTLNTILRRNLCEWSDDLSSRSRDERRSFAQELVPAHALYACENWTAHFVQVEQTSDPALLQVLDKFCGKGLLPWIEFQVYAGNPCEAREMLREAHSWAKVSVILHYQHTLLNYEHVPSGTRRIRGYLKDSM
jgi:hypothetical protein